MPGATERRGIVAEPQAPSGRRGPAPRDARPKARGSRARPSSRLELVARLAGDRVALVLVAIVLRVHVHRVLELADALADRAGDLGKALGPEHDQRDHED